MIAALKAVTNNCRQLAQVHHMLTCLRFVKAPHMKKITCAAVRAGWCSSGCVRPSFLAKQKKKRSPHLANGSCAAQAAHTAIQRCLFPVSPFPASTLNYSCLVKSDVVNFATVHPTGLWGREGVGGRVAGGGRRGASPKGRRCPTTHF